jgi:hypothetical protein
MKTLLVNRYKISIIICVCLILLLASECLGKTYAYLIGSDGTVVKLDIDTDTIASTKNLGIYDIQSLAQSVTVDDTKKLLYIAYGRLTPTVSVFNLKTLQLKKNLMITSGYGDARIIAPPLSNKFFVDCWDTERNGRFFTSFDATTFTKITDLSPFPVISFNIRYSTDKTKLYSVSLVKVDVYNADNLTLIKSIPLKGIFTPGIFGYGIDDCENEKILIVENIQKTKDEPGQYNLYTYSIENGTKTNKIITGMQGVSSLSPDATKIFFSEEQEVLAADSSIEYVKSLGRLHVYDVATGQEKGAVNFTVDQGSGIAGVHPSGNKVYMSGKVAGISSLLVIDVVNFKVAKTIKIPDTIQSMEFWTE